MQIINENLPANEDVIHIIQTKESFSQEEKGKILEWVCTEEGKKVNEIFMKEGDRAAFFALLHLFSPYMQTLRDDNREHT